MALHNEFDIANAWEEGVITSAKGDKAHVKMNAITGEVWIKTRIGDGNSQDWRKTNSTYQAIKNQNYQPLPAPNIVDDLVPTSPATNPTPHPVNGHEAAKIDMESVAPFGRSGRRSKSKETD